MTAIEIRRRRRRHDPDRHHRAHHRCARHGTNFAQVHKLDLPATQTPEVETIRTRGRTFDLCAACRHWLGRTDLDPGRCIDGCPCTAACHQKERAA